MTMYETRTMALEIRKMTIVAIVVVAIGAFVIYPSGLKSISMGILIGGFSGLWGFAMIVSLCEKIDGSTMNAIPYVCGCLCVECQSRCKYLRLTGRNAVT